MDLIDLTQSIGNAFSIGIFGHPLIIGVFIAVFFVYIALKSQIPLLDMGIIGIAPSLVILAQLGYVPAFLEPIVYIAFALITSIGFWRVYTSQAG